MPRTTYGGDLNQRDKPCLACLHFDFFLSAWVHSSVRLCLRHREGAEAWEQESSLPLELVDNGVNQIGGGGICASVGQFAGPPQNFGNKRLGHLSSTQWWISLWHSTVECGCCSWIQWAFFRNII